MNKLTNTTTPDLDPEWGIDIIKATILKRYIKVEILLHLQPVQLISLRLRPVFYMNTKVRKRYTFC